MEKRGSSLVQESIYLFFRIILFGLIIVIILALVSMYTNRKVDILQEETYIINQRLLRSSDCLAFEENQRVYQGIVDINKFEQSRLENCVALTDDKGFNVSLKYINGDITSLVVNDKIELYIDLCDVKKKHGFECMNRTDFVLIKDKDSLKPGYLNLEVIKIE